MSDGKTDGIVIMYCQDGVIYPIALTEDQMQLLDITVGMALGNKVSLIKNKAQGNAINYIAAAK
jgi:hypothetical protein